MTGDADTAAFRQRWIAELKKHSNAAAAPPTGDLWEGRAAYRELSETANLWVVKTEPDIDYSLFEYLMKKLSREVHFFRQFSKSVVAVNRSFEDVIEVLRSIENKIGRAKIEESVV